MFQQIQEKFKEHPKNVGETYGEHFKNATYFCVCSLVCSVIFFVHAVFPFLFETTGGCLVTHLEQQIRGDRVKSASLDVQEENSEEGIGIKEQPQNEPEESDELDGPEGQIVQN